MTPTTSSSPSLFFLAEGVSPAVNTKVPCFPFGRLCVILEEEEKEDRCTANAQHTLFIIRMYIISRATTKAVMVNTLMLTLKRFLAH